MGPVRVGIVDVVARRCANTLFLRYGVRCVQSNWWLLVLLCRLEGTSNYRGILLGHIVDYSDCIRSILRVDLLLVTKIRFL